MSVVVKPALEARNRGLRSFPYLMALATCANVGSAFTLTGNPQNMLVATLSDMSYGRYLLVAAVPVAAVGQGRCRCRSGDTEY